MANLYRKSALDKISSPEQLDKVLALTSPMSWLVLIGISIIIVVTVIWSFVGTIPVTVSGPGIVASPVGTNAVYMDNSGTIVSLIARTGTELGFGDPILTYTTGDDVVHTLLSDQNGTVSGVTVKVGDSVSQGSEALRVSPKLTGTQTVVCYIKLAQSKKIGRGMNVQISLDSADGQTYGYMWARVVNIDSYAASTDGMNAVLGKDNNLASSFAANGAVAAVTCELYPDAETVSGYDWSTKRGGTLAVSNGSPVTAKVIVEQVHPIEKLFSKLREIWGS